MRTIRTGDQGVRIVVEPGDTCYTIADQYTGEGLRWPELVRANAGKPRSPSGAFLSLVPGETLLVPVRWVERFGTPRASADAVG